MPEAPHDASFGRQADAALAGECTAATSLSLLAGSRPSQTAARLGTTWPPARVELQSWLGPAPMAPHRRRWPDIWVSARSAATVGGTALMKDFVWCRIRHRRVRPDLAVPALEPRQRGAEGAVLKRHHFSLRVGEPWRAASIRSWASPSRATERVLSGFPRGPGPNEGLSTTGNSLPHPALSRSGQLSQSPPSPPDSAGGGRAGHGSGAQATGAAKPRGAGAGWGGPRPRRGRAGPWPTGSS